MPKSDAHGMAQASGSGKAVAVRTTRHHAPLPIGRTARIAFELDTMRASCSRAARVITSHTPIDEAELEECARLDDSLAQAHRLLKSTVRSIMLSRIRRRSRQSNRGKRTRS